jgi:monofunctional biosynthetic peptidoglycan transglycosylase
MGEAFRDILSGGRTRGASTITMQVARTVYLWPERTWFRKLAEAYYTVWIEIFWSKPRILEMYLNTVDWGRDIAGGEAASRAYFHVSAQSLSPYQASLLAAILPNPHGWSASRPNRIVLGRQARILKDMEKMPLVSG